MTVTSDTYVDGDLEEIKSEWHRHSARHTYSRIPSYTFKKPERDDSDNGKDDDYLELEMEVLEVCGTTEMQN